MLSNWLLERRIISAFVALGLALAACGSDASSGGSPDANPLAPTPIHVSRTVGSGEIAAGTPLVAPSQGSVSNEPANPNDMIAPWVVYDYTVGSDLPALPAQANGWQYLPNPTIDPGRVAQIAKALGVNGNPVERPTEQGGGWIVGPQDGSAPGLYVAPDAQLSTWLSTPYGMISSTSGGCVNPDEVAPADQGGGTDPSNGSSTGTATTPADPCVVETPQPPGGILTSDQARSGATDLLRQMGADPGQFELQVQADQWFASVSALQRLDATTSPVGWYFGFGTNGRLENAGGVLAQPVKVGPYPLIDLATALVRLKDGSYGGIRPMSEQSVSMGAPDVLCEDPATCDQPSEEPEHIQITLTDVRQELWLAWGSDGSVWLLPAFTFLDADGGRYTVPAVTDEYLIMDDVLVDPTVDEPAAPPSNVGDATVVISDSEAATLIGLTEGDAIATASDRGWIVRVVERDGEQSAVTEDYSTSRVNLTITNDTVTAVTVG
ncbi:MAG: hypothetical protein JJE47_12330 [Acidimicrobiia bacterium]|nr:hypothetical protein [Acidimicrobiia bacterium]